ncbi:hypothetical protein C943_01555 [Mariniradius saccharolyticus AK6]|uniref:Outer membrane protein beta-barrel domain-containing protein n=1 Tax=Mariniradius saccharolyticus AK6 TaxID=1239962 RepID=M7XUX9_9BACT|nr:hypothetical protein [Mariniradius saccharolyticus]EMS32292.1 hypothetical protein C943_01555 [Mariniradius saccharolyticus AK6]
MRKFLLIALIVCSVPFLSKGQNLGSTKGNVALGVGIGLPYGGFGGKFSFNPANQLALFAGFGYNLVGLGTNFGAQYIFPSKKKTEFFLTGMYGYNAVIKIQGAQNLDDSFRGVTGGLGIRVNSAGYQGAFWDFGLLVPARSQEYKDSFDDIKNNPNITDLTEPWPVQLFVGFNFPLSGRKPQP